MIAPMEARGATVRLAWRGMRRAKWATVLGILLFVLPVCAFVSFYSVMNSDYGHDPAGETMPPARAYIISTPCEADFPEARCIKQENLGVLDAPIGDRLRDAFGADADLLHPMVSWPGGIAVTGPEGADLRSSVQVTATRGATDADRAAAGDLPAGTALPEPPEPGTVDVPRDVAGVLGIGTGDQVRLLLPDGGSVPATVGALTPSHLVEANITDVPQLVPDPAEPIGAVSPAVTVSWWLPAATDIPGALGEDGVILETYPIDPWEPQTIWDDFFPDFFTPYDYAFVLALMVLGIVVVAAVVAPVFAVSARRRRRELGLLSSIGARPSHLRAIMLAEGLLTGVIGAALGIAVSVPASWGFHALATDPSGHFHWSWSAAVVAAVAAILCGLTAALWPALQAAAEDPVEALADGSRSYRPRAVGWLWAGPILFVVCLLVFAFFPEDLGGVALVLAVLGLVLSAPALVRLAARAGRGLPAPGRMAARDADRSGARAPAATAAVTAVTAVGIIFSAVMLAGPTPSGNPRVVVASPTVSVNTTTPFDADIRDRMDGEDVIARANLWGAADPLTVTPISPVNPQDAAGDGWVPSSESLSVTIADPAWMRMLPDDPIKNTPAVADPAAAEAALTRGAALVADESQVRDGLITLALCAPAGEQHVPVTEGGYLPGDCDARTTLRVPAVVEPGITAGGAMSQGMHQTESSVVISPDTARKLTPELRFAAAHLLLAEPMGVLDVLAWKLGMMEGDDGALFWGGGDTMAVWHLESTVVMGGLGLLALAVITIVIALAGRETRAEVRLLRALGARPGTVRRYAGAQGLIIAGPATITGIVGAVALLSLARELHLLAGVPWVQVILYCVAVSAAAWLIGALVGARAGDGPPPRRRD